MKNILGSVQKSTFGGLALIYSFHSFNEVKVSSFFSELYIFKCFIQELSPERQHLSASLVCVGLFIKCASSIC